uniref:Uncharacterized protein n=1 Tax=Corethron hystrix TaxID=216773 RepID=A0A7S1BRQ5_9STRA|mmetsp:Transcript_36543/g.85427  ORF Transcript_36543/g.85427 Transcript_36543/m.85427 type:complete len:164 (+) Transcript_36543:956-1447(+)
MRGSYVGRGRTVGRDVIGTTARIVYEAAAVRYRWWRAGGAATRFSCGRRGWLYAAMEAECVSVARESGKMDAVALAGGADIFMKKGAEAIELGDGLSERDHNERAALSLSLGDSDGWNEELSDIPYTIMDVDNAKDALKILPVMACLPVFWMLFDQQVKYVYE